MDNGASSYRRFLSGDDNGIVDIIKDYKDGLMLFLNRYVNNIHVAEELTEDSGDVIQNTPDASTVEHSASEAPSGITPAPSDTSERRPVNADVSDKHAFIAATDLTQEALYESMGAFLPSELPEGFSFTSASSSDYGYSVIWSRGLEDLDWDIRDYKETDAHRITDVADTKNYDLSFYPIPRAESVPEELTEIVNNPIFRAEDLTQEAVCARAYKIDDANDSTGYRMHFSVLYGTKVVTVTSKGISPEWLYKQLSGLPATLN